MARVPFDPATDYYQLLGVRPSASNEEIHAAYRRLAKAYHPDLNAGSSLAAARMARVNAAKSVLLDSATRANYDRSRAIRLGFAPGRQARPAGPSATSAGPRAASPAEHVTPAEHVPVRYAAQPFGGRPRRRVVPHSAGSSTPRGAFDRQTGVLLVVAVPLIAVLVLYVFQAFQLSVQPLRAAPTDLNLPIAPLGDGRRPTTRGTADTVFLMVHTQPPDRELAIKANNYILSRTDSAPESEALRLDGRRLLRAAGSGDADLWDATVADLCLLAGRC